MENKFNYLTEKLLEVKTLKEALNIASKEIKNILHVDRVTLFIYSKELNVLYSYIADGIDKKLTIPLNKGVVGWVATNKQIKIVNDTSKEKLFYKEIEKTTNYQTKNLLTIPLLDIEDNLIGVLQLLNKPNGFKQEDIQTAILFAECITPPFEILLSTNTTL